MILVLPEGMKGFEIPRTLLSQYGDSALYRKIFFFLDREVQKCPHKFNSEKGVWTPSWKSTLDEL